MDSAGMKSAGGGFIRLLLLSLIRTLRQYHSQHGTYDYDNHSNDSDDRCNSSSSQDFSPKEAIVYSMN